MVAFNTSASEWNADFQFKLLPNTVILSLYLVVGVIGNSTVLLVYICGMRGKMQERYFIPALATFDLLATTFITTNKMMANLFPVTYTNDALCRSLNFFSRVFAASSDGLLLIISVQRFLKICKPFSFQMRKSHRRYAIVVVILGAIVLNFPVFIFYGIHTILYGGLTGYMCDHIHGNEVLEILMYAYDVMIFLILISSMMSMGVIYFFISKKISGNPIVNKLYRKRKIESESSDIPRTDRVTDNNVTENVSETMTTTLPQKEPSGVVNDKSEAKVVTKEKNMLRDTRNLVKRKKSSASEQIRTHFSANRYTYMFMALTMSFIITYFPANILKVVEIRLPNSWIYMSPAGCHIYLFFRQLYILNHVANPFIYSAFDGVFRQQLKHLVICRSNGK